MMIIIKVIQIVIVIIVIVIIIIIIIIVKIKIMIKLNNIKMLNIRELAELPSGYYERYLYERHFSKQ